jgi:hypothetical protein
MLFESTEGFDADSNGWPGDSQARQRQNEHRYSF